MVNLMLKTLKGVESTECLNKDVYTFCTLLIMASVPDQSNELSMLNDDDGSLSPDFLYHNLKD